MKCSNCCPHAQMTVPCPLTGFCNIKATSKTEILELPDYLLITLFRFGEVMMENKIDTTIEFCEKLTLPSGTIFSPISCIEHQGQSLNSGHYVTYSKDSTGQWWLLNDTNSNKVSFGQMVNSSLYIILLKKEALAAKQIDNTGSLQKRDLNNTKNCRNIQAQADRNVRDTYTGSKKNISIVCTESIGDEIAEVKKRKTLTDKEVSSQIEMLERKKNKMPDEQIELKRLKCVQRKRKSRFRQCREEQKTYLREFRRSERQKENNEKYEARKDTDRKRKRAVISNENMEQSKVRRESNKECMKLLRNQEVEEQHILRKEKERKQKADKRSKEKDKERKQKAKERKQKADERNKEKEKERNQKADKRNKEKVTQLKEKWRLKSA